MKIRSRWLTKAAAFSAVALCRLLFWTCRKKFIGVAVERCMETSQDDEYFVLCAWHDALLLPTFAAPLWLRQSCCCLVSQHQDGSYLADAMKWMDYTTVRGSSNRGGVEALRELVNDTAGKHIIVTPDGPRGPLHRVQPGIVKLAQLTGVPIIPVHMHYSHAIQFKTWDEFLLPLPFSKVTLVFDKPHHIPRRMTEDEFEQKRLALEDVMRFGTTLENLQGSR